MKILVFDDDTAAGELVERALRRLGHEPVLASDSQAGIDLLEEGTFGGLMVNIVMPTLSGVDFVKVARRAKPDLRIVAMSSEQPAYPAVTGLKAAQAVGADAILYRPFSDETLVMALAS